MSEERPISVSVEECRDGSIGNPYVVNILVWPTTFTAGHYDKETAERVADDVRKALASPPAPDVEKLAKETAVACVAVAYDDQDQLRENIEYIILSALNTVRTARDTGHEATMLQFELRMAQANEELAALSVRVAHSDDEIQSVCLRQKAEIARLTAENKEHVAKITGLTYENELLIEALKEALKQGVVEIARLNAIARTVAGPIAPHDA